MKRTFLLLGAVVILGALAGCESGPADQTAKVTNDAKPAPIANDPAKAALVGQMDAVARRTMGAWESLSEADKKPFLDMDSGDAAKAKVRYTNMVDVLKEQQSAGG